MSNVEQGILNIEVMNRCALPFLSTDGHFEIHVIDIRYWIFQPLQGGALSPPVLRVGVFLKKGKAGRVLPFFKLNVIVKKELMWMGSQFDGIDFIIDLVVDPHVDDILGKDITLFKKRLILLQCIQCFIQGARC